VRLSSRWLPYPAASLFALGLLFILLPVATRYWLGWSSWPGYVSDLGIGGLFLLLCYRRPLLAAPLAAAWALLLLSNAELVNAVGRMPEPSDIKYLSDPQFVSQSTQGSGIRYPLLAGALVIGVLACLLLGRKAGPKISRYAYVLPVALLFSHAIDQYIEPSEDDQWCLQPAPCAAG
jgi:hypothetical protein